MQLYGQLGHVGLNVTNLKVSLIFYTELFKLSILHESAQEGAAYAILGNEDGAVLTLWEQSAGRFRTDLPGLHHLAFRVATPEEVVIAQDKLKELDIPLIYDGIVLHAGDGEGGGIFFLDPDGIRVEIYCTSGMKQVADTSVSGPACGFF